MLKDLLQAVRNMFWQMVGSNECLKKISRKISIWQRQKKTKKAYSKGLKHRQKV